MLYICNFTLILSALSGAYYYGDAYHHNLTKMALPHANMEEVSVAVKAALDEQKVPIRYWQWDDW